jgi:hypothetical protein
LYPLFPLEGKKELVDAKIALYTINRLSPSNANSVTTEDNNILPT